MRPIVLVHGYLGFDNLASVEYFRGVANHLQQLFGVRVFATKTGPKDSVRERAADLDREISARFGSDPVHIIAHSIGGLDARYALTAMGSQAQARIASLTTVATPHAGTYLADIAIAARNPAALVPDVNFRRAISGAIEESAKLAVEFGLALVQNAGLKARGDASRAFDLTRSALMGAAAKDPTGVARYARKLFALSDAALPDLTRAGCATLFAGALPTDTPIFCYAAVGRPFGTMWPTLALGYLLLRVSDGDNDGVVPLTSACNFGKASGVFATDHAGVIGWGSGDCLPWYEGIVRNIRTHVPNA